MAAAPTPCAALAGGERGQREHNQSGDIHPLESEDIGCRAHAEQERRQRERVDVDHPLHLTERRPQIPEHRGQRDVDDRDVDQQHERPEADRDERQPLAHRSSHRQMQPGEICCLRTSPREPCRSSRLARAATSAAFA